MIIIKVIKNVTYKVIIIKVIKISLFVKKSGGSYLYYKKVKNENIANPGLAFQPVYDYSKGQFAIF